MQLETNRWFAIHVVPNLETKVGISLDSKGYESFVPTWRRRIPTGRRHLKIEPMFPGYVFFRMHQQAKSPVVTIPGVIRIVGYGSVPTPVEDTEITSLQRIVDSGVDAQPLPRIEKGAPIVIQKGPLAGVRGVMQRVNRRRNLIVLVPLLGRSVLIELSPDWA